MPSRWGQRPSPSCRGPPRGHLPCLSPGLGLRPRDPPLDPSWAPGEEKKPSPGGRVEPPGPGVGFTSRGPCVLGTDEPACLPTFGLSLNIISSVSVSATLHGVQGSPDQGLSLWPLQRKRSVLATGLPGSSVSIVSLQRRPLPSKHPEATILSVLVSFPWLLAQSQGLYPCPSLPIGCELHKGRSWAEGDTLCLQGLARSRYSVDDG